MNTGEGDESLESVSSLVWKFSASIARDQNLPSLFGARVNTSGVQSDFL